MPFLKKIQNKKSKWEMRNENLDVEMGGGKNLTSHFVSPASHFQFLIYRSLRNWKFLGGYTLIELLVVIAIFGLTASLVTASYLSFERNQRIKNAALMIKSDIRLVADKAFSGDKGVGAGASCSTTDQLGGWYIKFNWTSGNNTSYIIAGDCIPSSGSDVAFNSRSINLPKDVKISAISYGIRSPLNSISVLFRPLSQGVYINEENSPPFFTAPPRSLKLTSYNTNDNLIIVLEFQSAQYQVIINPAGETQVVKI